MTEPTPGTILVNGLEFYVDAKGRHVPPSVMKPQLVLEDQLVRTVMQHADELSGQIARFKGHCVDDIATFLDLLREEYGAKRGGQKGNMTFTTIDGCFRVQVSIADQITFGPELEIAKDLIDECIAEWSEGSRDEIRGLIQHAFEPRSKGLVNREALFALRKVKIEDERWEQAMQAITDSIRVYGSKQYVRFHRRAAPTDEWANVTINIASARAPRIAAE